MSVAEWVIPVLTFAALMFTLPSHKAGVKPKHYLFVLLGIVSLGFAWWNSWDNSDTIKETKQSNKNLQENSIKLLEQRRSDSINNATINIELRKYLRDSFNLDLERRGIIPDSSNYSYIIDGAQDRLTIYPKQGVWFRPYFAYDTSISGFMLGSYQGENLTIDDSNESILIHARFYVLQKAFINSIASKEKPIVLDVFNFNRLHLHPRLGAKIHPLFFGDYADPLKRYMYIKGNVYWVPFDNYISH